MDTDLFSIRNMTRSRTPVLPYYDIAKRVLGTKYELSLAFIGRDRSQNINKQLRHKDKPADVLSIPLSKTSGEIMICLERAKKQAKKFEHTYTQHVAFLFIHGLLHLKGLDHGSTMEHEERRLMSAFDVC